MPQQQQDLDYMSYVYRLALESAERGFAPFAAILVQEGSIVSTSKDRCIQYSDPTAHAELVLISEFCRENQVISLEGYTMYCNVEPCVMCSGAIHWARISRLVFGVRQAALQSVSKGKTKPGCEALINIGKIKIEITGPLLEEEGLKILKQFPFKSKKQLQQEYRAK